ncbi:winged helix-turn-helix domain-containing protein [Lichenicoccus sp.]|uniref:winged helix-turn-helix domain-containing protein n=1 Tax=Lichenicoccus sp. TaxID=2781899 RepID=UPI003D0EA965
MSMPDYQALMLPVLLAARRGEVRVGDVVAMLAQQLALTPDERAELLPSGKQTVFANRVHWAKTYLSKAGLLETTRRGHFQITRRGTQLLATKPDKIDNRMLIRFDEFREFTNRSGPGAGGERGRFSRAGRWPGCDPGRGHARCPPADRGCIGPGGSGPDPERAAGVLRAAAR